MKNYRWKLFVWWWKENWGGIFEIAYFVLVIYFGLCMGVRRFLVGTPIINIVIASLVAARLCYLIYPALFYIWDILTGKGLRK